MKPEAPLVSIRDLETYYSIRGSFADRLVGREAGVVKAVDGVSLDIRRGEVLGLVGESGSGKTTLGRTLLGLVRATGGSVVFDGRDITHLPERELRPLRRRVQVVFQDPHASLNPAMTIAQAVGHPLEIHGLVKGRAQQRAQVAAVLERVGLAPAEQFLDKYPSDLSGGQKQRAVIARAIILNPVLLVADEPVSMLDMSVRAKILELMLALKRDLDLTYLYITHDLATAKFFCDRIAIMYLGRIVEIGPAEAIYADPKHPYTQALLRAIPEPDPLRESLRDLPRGEVPDAARPPLGCAFHPRCPKAFGVCGWESRDLRDLLDQRWAAGGRELYERERPLVGDLSVLDRPATSVHVPGAGLESLIERMRAETPDEPFWSGLAGVQAANGGVDIAWREGIDPRLRAVDGVEVACHLYDPDARGRVS
ncbi:MAG TPA: ABC transporter ATP-binding protein [Gaiellaceae bacterium]|nr:ABC transporter ATP-binding protein [Gaiellaceae bacterium]